MLRQRQQQIELLAALMDVLIAIGAFFIAYEIRNQSALFSRGQSLNIGDLSWMLAAALAIHWAAYPRFGLYSSLRTRRISEILLGVVQSCVVEFFILGTLVFVLQAKETSRWFFGLFLALNYVMIFAERVSVRTALASIRRRSYNYRHVFFVGEGKSAQRTLKTLQQNPHWGYRPMGVLLMPDDTRANDGGVSALGLPVIGKITELEEIVKTRPVDEIYFTLDYISEDLDPYVYLCETLGIPARFPLGMFDLPHSKAAFGQLGTMPMLTYYTTLLTPVDFLLKRSMDIVISLMGLTILAVLFPWIYFSIKRQSPGPVIFKQRRIGENGRTFKCYKFRTMSVDAESRKAELMEKNTMEGPIFKIAHDPRVFPFGAFLRKTSLDELPQFFNIFRGDMSVVGTRPPTPDEVEKYKTYYRRRLSIRPGLTGMWQISGRNEVTNFEDILALDLHYIDHWSIWLDFKIIAKTFWVILFRKGAY